MLLPKIHGESCKSQHEVANCLTNLIAFYDKLSEFVDARQDLDFCKAFNTLSRSILISKVRYHSLDEWLTRQ